MPGAIINGIMSVFTGKFYDKYGPRPLIYTGFTILTITTIMLCFLHTRHILYVFNSRICN